MRLRPTARGRKSLAKLDKAQRISAEEALLRFLNDPRAPGLHFEKLKGHSDLHTIRINRKLRLFLRATDEADLFEIVDAGPHDLYGRTG